MSARPRARDLGIHIGTMEPGPLNAISDVAGVGVGHCTLIEGDGPLVVGRGPVRTGVTVVVPHEGDIAREPVFAAPHRLNGNGEMTGLEWVRESGLLSSPIGLTNTHSIGVVHEALVAHEIGLRKPGDIAWSLPVVAETWDGRLNDINGFHVRREHVDAAIHDATRGPFAEGSVGGGTGMVSFGFKAGIGTSSRVVPVADRSFVLGVLVQSNFGSRHRFTVDGVPAGRFLTPELIPLPTDRADEPDEIAAARGSGSIIVVAATDAPLLPHQCARIAQRISLGVGRLGGAGGNYSGDLFLCFATGNRGLSASEIALDGPSSAPTQRVEMLDDAYIDAFFHAVIEATEEAVLNALLAAETMVGRDNLTAHALPVDDLVAILERGWSPLGR